MTPEHGIIIVTGSNGRIGEAVMRRLAGRFTDVVGFHRKAPKPSPPGCVYIPVEITSAESVRDGLRTIREHHGAHVASGGGAGRCSLLPQAKSSPDPDTSRRV